MTRLKRFWTTDAVEHAWILVGKHGTWPSTYDTASSITIIPSQFPGICRLLLSIPLRLDHNGNIKFRSRGIDGEMPWHFTTLKAERRELGRRSDKMGTNETWTHARSNW